MAGHSKFKNIMYRKGAQDKKRAREFAKLSREIMVAAKLGTPDPGMNPRLRSAIAAARAQSMPKDNIERAIKKGSGDLDGADYVEMRYEGYGPGGVAVIVETLTDNKNRTASDVRATFNKLGGAMGETGSVSFNFERRGLITYALDSADAETIFEVALEAGATDVESTDEQHEISCEPDELHVVLDALVAKFGDPTDSGLDWKPLNTTELDEEKARTLLKLVDTLEDHDDVQDVFTNMDVPDDIMEKLSAE
ncbi:YebC/PmpR family DNA-binding transcriptional regulator [Magnetospira thiophila]